MNLTAPAANRVYAARPNSQRIVDVYRFATLAELDEGMNWYRTARALAVAISPESPETGAGVIAALSPMMRWDRNMMLAIRAFEDGEASGALYGNVAKANAIMAGAAPLDVLGGDKVRNFYGAIADPNSATAVCIDRHAFDIAVGRVTNDKSRNALARKGVYENFADAYRRAAKQITRETGIFHTPATVQAITWVCWRRLKGLTD